MRAVFSSEARRDRREAEAYYGAVSRRLRERFRDDLRAALQFLGQYPYGAPARDFDIRAKTLRHFPYTVLYRVINDKIFVLAVAHQRRHPDAYADRQ